MNKSLRYLFGIALWFAPMIASAAIPQGYYTSLNGKMGGATLKTAGQLITRLPVIENNMEVTLPSGIYFITTNQMQRPIKIVAN